jgi:hypothetical protein
MIDIIRSSVADRCDLDDDFEDVFNILRDMRAGKTFSDEEVDASRRVD